MAERLGRRLLPSLSLLLVVAVTYRGAVGNSWTIDDGPLVLANPAVHGLTFANLLAIATSVSNHVEYLPVRDLTYAIDHALWGLDPFGYHLSNIVYYALCCVLLYFVLSEWLALWVPWAGRAALVTALLWAAHPGHVEAVAGVAFRKDLVAGACLFGALLAYLRWLARGGWSLYCAALALFLLAALAKGTTLMLPLLLLSLHRYHPRHRAEPIKRSLVFTLPFLGMAAGLGILHAMVAVETGAILPGYLGTGGTYHLRLLSAAKAVVYYLRLLAWPDPLLILHPFRLVRSALDPAAWLSVGLVLALVLGAVGGWRRFPLASWLITWFLICLLPVVGLVPAAVVVTERYLFFPSTAFACALGLLLARPSARQQSLATAASVLIGVALLAGYIKLSQARVPDWRDALTLYSADAAKVPSSPRLQWLVGRELYEMGRQAEAMLRFQRAAAINGNYAIDLRIFRARWAVERGDPAAALGYLHGLPLVAKTQIMDYNHTYGLALLARGDREEARRSFAAALASPISLGIFTRQQALQMLRSLD